MDELAGEQCEAVLEAMGAWLEPEDARVAAVAARLAEVKADVGG